MIKNILILGLILLVATNVAIAKSREANQDLLKIEKELQEVVGKYQSAIDSKNTDAFPTLAKQLRAIDEKLDGFQKKYKNETGYSEDVVKYKAFLESAISTSDQYSKAKSSREYKQKAGQSSAAVEVIAYHQLDRMKNVGMKIGKRYWVTARHVTHSSSHALKPIAERDSEGRRITSFIMISVDALDENQRGVLYDLQNNVGCFEVAGMSNGTIELTDVKTGACQ